MTAYIITGLCIMIAIIGISIIGNVGVLFVILKTADLRTQVTYMYVLNLCFVDLLASVFILPLSTAAYYQQTWPFSHFLCLTEGFVNSICMFGSIWAICLISIERFYCIKWPMHYAVHVTCKKAMSLLVTFWMVAIASAVCPLFGWGSITYHHDKYHCTFTASHPSYTICIFVICFCLPAIVTLCMYHGIYRVAKQTASQIYPDINHVLPVADIIPHNQQQEEPNNPYSVEDSGVSCLSKTRVTNGGVIDVQIDSPVVLDTPSSGEQRMVSHWKAIRTLCIIITFFVALWAPYFVVVLHNRNENKSDPTSSLITLWLGFVSYATNPFVYGLLNRTVREAITAIYSQIRCGKQDDDIPAIEIADNEDFFQFLERTSSSRNLSLPSNKLQPLSVNNLPVVEELETFRATARQPDI